MPVSPVLRAQATYPFVRLNQAAAERRARGLEVIDFGMGDPREPTDQRILQALRDGVRELAGSVGELPFGLVPEQVTVLDDSVRVTASGTDVDLAQA